MTQNEEIKNLEKIALGDHDAFHAIFIEYFPKIKYFIAHIIKSESVAEDLSQDIFLKIWNSREYLPELRSFKAYIFRMTRNAAFNYLDHKFVEDSYITNHQSSTSVATPEEELEAMELELLLEFAIEKMPEQRRKIFKMSRIENLNNEEIAAKIGVTKKTVSNQLSLAQKEIRDILTLALLFFLIK